MENLLDRLHLWAKIDAGCSCQCKSRLKLVDKQGCSEQQYENNQERDDSEKRIPVLFRGMRRFDSRKGRGSRASLGFWAWEIKIDSRRFIVFATKPLRL